MIITLYGFRNITILEDCDGNFSLIWKSSFSLWFHLVTADHKYDIKRQVIAILFYVNTLWFVVQWLMRQVQLPCQRNGLECAATSNTMFESMSTLILFDATLPVLSQVNRLPVHCCKQHFDFSIVHLSSSQCITEK